MPGIVTTSQGENVESTYSFACTEIINAVEFSPFQNTANLIAYGGENRICVGSCTFEDSQDLQEFCFDHQIDILHGARVDVIGWSPQSALDQYPGLLRFCTAGGDKKLRCFSVGLRHSTTVQIFDGHESYINDCVFSPINGDIIASVSDDHTCRLWDVESGQEKVAFRLSSPGVSVKWIPNEPDKILVAQKNGIIRFYDIVSQHPFMTLSTSAAPVKCVDWSTTNTVRVGGVASNEFQIWDTTISRTVSNLILPFPQQDLVMTGHTCVIMQFNTETVYFSSPRASKEAHVDGVCLFRWCKLSDSLFATSGRPGNQVKVYQVGHHKNPVVGDLKVGGGLTWHSRLPICAAGGDHLVHLWRLEL